MPSDFKKITEKVREAMINPELDKTKSALQKAREELKDTPDKTDLVANIVERAKRPLSEDLTELKVPGDQQVELISAFERRFKVATTGLEKEAILGSLEAKKLDAFVNDYTKYTRLDAVIAECKARDSKDPMKRFVRMMQAASPFFVGIGAGIMKWLNEGKKAITEESRPSELETAAARADAVLEGKPPSSGEEKRGKSGSGKARAESGKSVDYPINPEYSKKLGPAEFRKKYQEIKDQHARHIFVLQQVAAGNVDNDNFEHLTITGKNGTKLEMDVDRSGLRVAGMEVQLDGPTAMAAAQLTDCTLPTPWISDQVYEHAKENGGVVPFFDTRAIATALGTNWEDPSHPGHPDGNKMTGAEFALKRDELIRKYREEHGIRDDQLIAGYFKDIIHPTASTRRHMLDFYGGKREDGTNIQGAGGNAHGERYADYSHQLRRVRKKVKVNGEPKDLSEFYSNSEYAKEFGFTPMRLGQAYALAPALKRFVESNKPS